MNHKYLCINRSSAGEGLGERFFDNPPNSTYFRKYLTKNITHKKSPPNNFGRLFQIGISTIILVKQLHRLRVQFRLYLSNRLPLHRQNHRFRPSILLYRCQL